MSKQIEHRMHSSATHSTVHRVRLASYTVIQCKSSEVVNQFWFNSLSDLITDWYKVTCISLVSYVTSSELWLLSENNIIVIMIALLRSY